MAVKKISWQFPLKSFFFLKVETLFVAILAIIVFFISFLQADQGWFAAITLTIAFLGVYVLLSYLIQKIRAVEEKYHLTSTHLEVVRKTRKKIKKVKVPLKEVRHHRLDKRFLGGYLLTRKGKKHLLFFNTKQEAEKFENFIKKHLKTVGTEIKPKEVKPKKVKAERTAKRRKKGKS